MLDADGLLGTSDSQFDRYAQAVAGMSDSEELGLAAAGAAAAMGPTAGRVAKAAAIAFAKKNADRFSFDGPSPGLQYGNGQICQARFDKKPLVRLDYHPYPGTNGQRCTLKMYDGHAPVFALA